MLNLVLTLTRGLLRLCFGFRAHGVESLQVRGPALLIPNHVSWLDWLFLGVVLDDDWRFVTSSRTAETSWIHRRLMKGDRTFPVDMSSPYAVRDMASYLEKGGRLVLFAEGGGGRPGDPYGKGLGPVDVTGGAREFRHALRAKCGPQGARRHEGGGPGLGAGRRAG